MRRQSLATLGHDMAYDAHNEMLYVVEKDGNQAISWYWTSSPLAPTIQQDYLPMHSSGGRALVSGEDGRAVMEIIFAAYESAGTGKKVELPFKTDAAKPWDLWKNRD